MPPLRILIPVSKSSVPLDERADRRLNLKQVKTSSSLPKVRSTASLYLTYLWRVSLNMPPW